MLEIDKVEATVTKVALKKLISEMTEELTERKTAGNTSIEGDKQLNYVKELLKKVENYLKDEFVPANPLSEYPKTNPLIQNRG